MSSAEPPSGPRNHSVVEAARLHRSADRRSRGQTLIEGPRLFAEAVQAGAVVGTVFALPDDRVTFDYCREMGIEPVPVTEAALARLADTVSPQGPIAVVDIMESRLEDDRSVLVSWGVSDAGNAGALIRVAAAFGWGFAYTQGSADPWSPKTLRSGSGGHFKTPISRISGIEDLEGWTTIAAVPRRGVDPTELKKRRYALLIGEEARGLPEDVASECAERVTIPMPGGTESLNAAVAAGIIVHSLS